MSDPGNQARAIFLEAIEIEPPAQRAEYLQEACQGNTELRERVERLLRSHEQLGSFQDDTSANAATLNPPVTEQPGTQIGPYKLLQQLGEGGMGVVYMAEQKEPVKRRVALKIIKPGMDTRQVIARFEAERQALAMMDHPNIAKVLDAGATESGRPYFVMELVNGIAVTKYCDEQHRSPQERLELFVPICQAVQHAHQKGIIHRDLKPSNILVALYDGQPVPKIIDFGVAKATSQTLTEKTMFTQLGQVVGTLEYMSPEQAQRNQLDIDTRSDIYSLGVVLYELLTGETPFDRQRLRSAAFDELLRIIREEEPPKPSTKVSTSESLASIATNRHVEPKKLTALVRGELDWIVMKALEKDRARRYVTASAFAEDVQHYLENEPVDACPPSRAYRLRKFVGRNKAALGTATVVAFALVLGVLGTCWQAVRATNEARRATVAEQLAQTRYEESKTKYEEAEVARQREAEARKKAEAMWRVAAQAQRNAERQLLRLTFNNVKPQLDEAIRLDPTRYGLYVRRALVHLNVQNLDQAIRDSNEATRLNPSASRPYSLRAEAYLHKEDYDLAIAACDAAIRLNPHDDWALYCRANAYLAKKDYRRAAEDFRSEVDITPTDCLMLRLLDAEMAIGVSAKTAQALITEAESILGQPTALGITYQVAAWHLLSNQKSEYDDVCRNAARQFAESKDPGALYIISRAAALSNEPVVDTKRLVAMATVTVKACADPWATHALGLCLLRDGQENAAVERFQQSLTLTWDAAPVNWLGLAIAHYRLGQVDQAQVWLRKTQEWCTQHPLDLTSDLHPHERIACQLLLREAEELKEEAATQGRRPADN